MPKTRNIPRKWSSSMKRGRGVSTFGKEKNSSGGYRSPVRTQAPQTRQWTASPANGNSCGLFTAFRCRPFHHVSLVLAEARRLVCRSFDHTGANCAGCTEATIVGARLARILRRRDRSGCTREQSNEWKNEFLHTRHSPALGPLQKMRPSVHGAASSDLD